MVPQNFFVGITFISCSELTMQQIQYQQTTTSSINDLKTQVGQLAIAMNQMKTQSIGNLPAQTIPNPNVSAITLRSGKNVDVPVGTSAETSGGKNEKIDKNKQTHASTPAPTPNSPTSEPDEEDEQSIPLPFPQRAVKSKKMDQVDKEREILDIFKKVEVYIPLLEKRSNCN